MTFFSKDLSFRAVYVNTIFGVLVLVDEWYWLMADALFKLTLKKLYVRLKKIDNTFQKEEFEEYIENLKLLHAECRKKQVEKRVIYTHIILEEKGK